MQPQLSVADPFEQELQQRMQLAQQQGWKPEDVMRSAMMERMTRQQQMQQQQMMQQSQAQAAPPQQPAQPSFWKSLLVNGGALAADTLAGIGGVAAAPFTGGASLLGTAAVGAGTEALRRKLLGQNQSFGADLFNGALTALPGAIEAKDAIFGAKAAKDALAVAPEAGQIGSNIMDMFKAGDKGAVTNKLEDIGSNLRADTRGIVPGLRPQGAAGPLTPSSADSLNEFMDANAHGNVQQQLAQINEFKQRAGQQVADAVTSNNVPLAPTTTQELADQALTNIKGVNGKGIPGYNSSYHQPIIDSYNNLLNSATDLKGLNSFKQSLDADVLNYGRNSAAADPIREQIAQQYRNTVADKIKSLDTSGAIGDANKQYSMATQAENALLKSKGLNPKGVSAMGISLGGNGVGGSAIQGAKDLAGRGIQNVSDLFTIPAVQQAAQQYGIHAAGNALTGGGDSAPAPSSQLPADPASMLGAPQAAAGPSADPNAALFGVDPMAANAQTAGMGSAGPSNGLQYSSVDLANAAMRALAAGDAKSYSTLSNASTMVAGIEKQQAAAGGGGDQKLSTAQQKDIASVKNASGMLDAIEQQFTSAGGGKGPAGYAYNIPVVGQYLNPKMGAYNQTKVDAATAYAKALAGGGQGGSNQNLIEEVSRALPSATDTPEMAKQKLANLRMHLQHREQTVLNYPYLSSDLPSTADQISGLLSGGQGQLPADLSQLVGAGGY